MNIMKQKGTTLVQRACAKVAGFQKAYKRLEKKIIVSGKSLSTLDTMEFIRRFSLHILPKGFMRIRHYGILSSSRKQKTLHLIHQQLDSLYLVPEKKDWKQISTDLGFNPDCCPACKQQTMITLLSFDRRGPPDDTIIRSFTEKVLASHS